MPIFDKQAKTLYTDGKLGLEGFPYIMTKEGRTYFSLQGKRIIHKRITSLEALLYCYKEVGVQVEPMGKLGQLLNLQIIEISPYAFFVDGRLVKLSTKDRNRGLNISSLALALGYSKGEWGSARQRLYRNLRKEHLKPKISQVSIFLEMLRKQRSAQGFIADHTGRSFSNRQKMLDHWGVSRLTFEARMRYGWTLKKALETPVKERPKVIDHKGREFKNLSAMCAHWGIPCSLFCLRRSRGWSLKKSLETQGRDRSKVVKDHKGNEFETNKEMALFWGHPNHKLILNRLRSGWSLERALETPSRRKENNKKRS